MKSIEVTDKYGGESFTWTVYEQVFTGRKSDTCI